MEIKINEISLHTLLQSITELKLGSHRPLQMLFFPGDSLLGLYCTCPPYLPLASETHPLFSL